MNLAIPSTGAMARILIVDDETEFLRVLVRQVKGLGYEVDGASDAAQALSLSARCGYDVALIDLRMKVNGIELMDRIAGSAPNMSFILITGAADVRDEDTRSIGERLTGVLLKPFSVAHLLDALAQAVQANGTRTRSQFPEVPVRVLIVEDSPSDAFLLMQTLKDTGSYEVEHVGNLTGAVRRLHEQEFDTVITDLSLPDALGVGAVVRLREAAPDVTLLVHSATCDENVVLRAVELGAQDFIAKGASDENIARSLRFARVRRRAERRLVSLAHSDGLTGLSNRVAFAAAMDRALLEARRSGGRLTLLFIDLDGFKGVNDQHGHDTGDELLKAIATRIRACVRDYDVVARLGGDEFAVLAPDLSDDALRVLGQRLLESISANLCIRAFSIKVSASIGTASFPDDARDSARLLHFADQAMYAAKRDGRDRIRHASAKE